MKYKRWVRAEVVIIKQCAGSMTVERIGQLIGRTGAAVRTKARELKICMYLRGNYHQSVKYLQEDIELARELHQLKWSTKTGHRVRVFSSIDFPIRLVVT
ncbi:DNA-binding protein, partial [Escherichia coli]|nr:DNA-binding protein [Escherichia coli]